MVVNFTNFKTFRKCKICQSHKTSMSKRGNNGTFHENWYIDKSSPEGGWVCYSCYHQNKRDSIYIINEIEFTRLSSEVYTGALRVKCQP